jgi:hypothetical protein
MIKSHTNSFGNESVLEFFNGLFNCPVNEVNEFILSEVVFMFIFKSSKIEKNETTSVTPIIPKLFIYFFQYIIPNQNETEQDYEHKVIKEFFNLFKNINELDEKEYDSFYEEYLSIIDLFITFDKNMLKNFNLKKIIFDKKDYILS